MPQEVEKLNIDPDKFPSERYEILEELGKGSAGIVYLCRDMTLNKTVAVKTLHELNADQLVDFQKEARATAKLDHPNIVKILDFGATEFGIPYMVMDFIPGMSLENYVKEHGVLDTELAIAVFSKLADALDYAHSKKVFHRDLKPSNIILYETDSGMDVSLIDFGIARVKEVTGSVTVYQKRTLAGTPCYMSPDIVLGESFDARSEIYSLGCVMFESLTGNPPFTGESALETLSKHASEELPDLEFLLQDKPEFVPVIAKCLEKSKGDRYDSMQELKEALFGIYGFEYSVEMESPETDRKPKTRLRILPMAILVLFILVLGAVVNSIIFMGKNSTLSEAKVELLPMSAPETSIIANIQARTVQVKKGEYRIYQLPRNTTTNLRVLFRDRYVNDLTFEDCDLRDHKLRELKGFKLDSIELNACKLDSDTFDDLTDLKGVRQIILVGFSLNNQLKPLQKLSPSAVAFKGCRLTKSTMNDLSSVESLNFLRITNCRIDKDSLLELSKFKGLKAIYLSDHEIDEQLTKTIGNLSTIKDITFNECNLSYKDLFSELSKLKQMGTFDLRKSSLENLDLNQLRLMKSVRVLRTTDFPKKMTGILKDMRVESLLLDRNPSITNQDVLELANVRSLKSIRVMECPKISKVLPDYFKKRKSNCAVYVDNTFASLVD